MRATMRRRRLDMEREARPRAPPSSSVSISPELFLYLASDGGCCIGNRLYGVFLLLEDQVNSLRPIRPHGRHLRDSGHRHATLGRRGKSCELLVIGVG